MREHEILVVEIPEIEKHPDADALGIVHFDGVTIVINDQWKTGDKAVLIPADFVVPAIPAFSFLGDKPKHRRIKPKKLRGVWSEGLLMPLSELKIEAMTNNQVKVGDCVMELVGIERYDFENKEHNPSYVDSGDPLTGEPPGLCISKYTLHPYKKYVHKLVLGEEVVITEKLHGCLKYETRVTLADGSKKTIGNIVRDGLIGTEVLGLNQDGVVVPTKITNVFKNGKTDNWLRVAFTRKGFSNGGNSYGVVHCTPNHKFLVGDKYIPAGELSAGDILTSRRNEDSLTPVQEQVLLGKLLGDAYLARTESSAFIQYGHTEKQLEYVQWCQRFLGDLANHKTSFAVSGYGTPMVRASTHGSYRVKSVFEELYITGTKEITEKLADLIGPIALAFWFMDDGSRSVNPPQQDRVSFATCGFSLDSVKLLCGALKRLGIDSTIGDTERGTPRINLTADDSEKLFMLIFPYICPSMKYKLPPRYQGFNSWDLPEQAREYKPGTYPQTVISITPITSSYEKYDIETETHNFFANDVVVHNSNHRMLISAVDEQLYIGSRTQWKDPLFLSSPHTRMQLCANGQVAMCWCEDNPDKVLFGEVFGWVAGLRYGADQGQLFYRAFDVWNNNTKEWEEVPEELKEIKVPELYRGPWDPAIAESLVDGQSMIPGANHIREGIVIEPLTNKRDSHIGRRKFKYVSNDYLASGK